MVIALTNIAQSYAKTKHFQQKLSFSCKKVRNHCNASEIVPDFIVVVFGSFDIRLDNTFTHVCPISAVLCDVPWFVRVCFCCVVIFLACRRIARSCSSDALYMFKLRARNRAPRGNFRDNVHLKAQCLVSILVGWMQLASVGVCLLSSCKVRYPQNKNIFKNSLKVKHLSLCIKYMMIFGVTVEEIDSLRRKNNFCKTI